MDKIKAKLIIQDFCTDARRLMTSEDNDDIEDFTVDWFFQDRIHELILDYISEPEPYIEESFKERVINTVINDIVNHGELHKVIKDTA